MKKIFGIFSILMFWLLLSSKTIAHPYEPTILILSPNKTNADKKLQNEIQKYNTQLRLKSQEIAQQYEEELNDPDYQAENLKIMQKKKIAFTKNIDFYKEISLIAEGYLQYRFFERFNNLLIYAVGEKSDSSITSLALLANKYEMQYVLNFPKVVSFIENKSKRTTITVELYDNKSKKVVLYKDFTGDDINPGFEFTCTDKSIECTVNNSLSKALGEIISVIAANNPTIAKNKILAQERTQALLPYYYTKAHEKEILDIIKSNDASISTEGFYSGLMNDSTTKFISFFASKSQVSDFQKLSKQDDKNVHIMSEDIKDLDNIPKIYAYIVIGLYYQGKWYLKKDQVIYFNTDSLESGRKEFFTNLQNWNFFKENSTDFNPDFWNTNFFDKVPDLTKDKNWPKYKESWKTEEENNRPYVGMYNIVADYLRGEYDKQSKDFINSMSKQVLLPFMEQLKTDSSQDVKDFALLYNAFTLIFPKDMSIALNPVQVVTTKGQRILRYFLIFPTTENVYEWTYFKPLVLTSKSWHYGSDIIEQLSVLTDWNFSLYYLEDKNFWDNYVLKKENAEYVYLKKMK